MINDDREYMLGEEYFLVRHSGEIPEVALHASLHYLCEDEEGPRFILADEELRPLQDAALARYQEIILRDLDVRNRDLSLFRGIKRAICNWDRYSRFSEGIGSPREDFREEAGRALCLYLQQELEEVCAGKRLPTVNCSPEALIAFAYTLGVDLATLPGNWACLCEKTR